MKLIRREIIWKRFKTSSIELSACASVVNHIFIESLSGCTQFWAWKKRLLVTLLYMDIQKTYISTRNHLFASWMARVRKHREFSPKARSDMNSFKSVTEQSGLWMKNPRRICSTSRGVWPWTGKRHRDMPSRGRWCNQWVQAISTSCQRLGLRDQVTEIRQFTKERIRRSGLEKCLFSYRSSPGPCFTRDSENLLGDQQDVGR